MTEWRGERFHLSRGSLLTPLTATDPRVGELGQGGDA